MKLLIKIPVLLFATCSYVLAEDLPRDVRSLIQKREDEIAKITTVYREEMGKLLVKYTKKGDLNSANAIKSLLDNESVASPSFILGEKNFIYKGKTRTFKFLEDGTYIGSYPKSGKKHAGTWEQKGDVVYTKRIGEKKTHATLTLRKDGAIEYKAEGYSMSAPSKK